MGRLLWLRETSFARSLVGFPLLVCLQLEAGGDESNGGSDSECDLVS